MGSAARNGQRQEGVSAAGEDRARDDTATTRHGPASARPALPARDGAAATLAHLMHERGMSASIRPAGRALVLTIRNPAVPFGKLAQQVAVVPDDGHGEALLWLFDGARPGTWDTEPFCPASEVEAAADRLARVLALAEQADAR